MQTDDAHPAAAKTAVLAGPSPRDEPDDELAVMFERAGYAVERATIEACPTCGFYDCVCATRHAHADGCRLRTAMECPVEVPCDHGLHVCPACAPCTCRPVAP